MSLDRRHFMLAGGAAVAGTILDTPLSAADPNDDAAAFIKDHVAKMRPLEVQAGIAWWNANTTGNDDDFKKKEEAQNKIDEALADKKVFERLKPLKAAAD